MSFSVNELKVLLFLENNLDKPVLEYFDPLIYLYNSPVFITDSFRESVKSWYIEKIRSLNMIDIYFLSKLNDEVIYRNEILDEALLCDYAQNKLNLLSVLGGLPEEFSSMSSVEYFSKYPLGRCVSSSPN